MKKIHYLAIGDSLTAGYGAPAGLGFVDRLQRMLERQLEEEVCVTNLGVNGLTTGDILERLRKDSRIARLAETAEIITLTAGGNDLLRAAEQFLQDQKLLHLISALRVCHDNYRQLVRTLRGLRQGASRPCAVRLVSLYNPSPGLPEADLCVKRFNGILRKCRDRDIRDVDVYRAFKGRERELMYEDGVHPNARGYQVMAEQVFDSLCPAGIGQR